MERLKNRREPVIGGQAYKEGGKRLKKRFMVALLLILMLVPGQAVQAMPVRVPEEVKQLSAEFGEQYNICPELIQAICFKESNFDPRAENGGCIGIMQVNPAWHQDRMERLGITDLYDTAGNMLVGVDYLSELAGKYEDISIVLMLYNGDSDTEDVLNGTADISAYASEILAISEELERENGK